MVTPVNPDKSVSSRADKSLQSNQRMPTASGHQPKDAAVSHSTSPTENQVDVESARQFYQMENQRADNHRFPYHDLAASQVAARSDPPTIHGRPGESLQAQSPNGPAALANLLERAPA